MKRSGLAFVLCLAVGGVALAREGRAAVGTACQAVVIEDLVRLAVRCEGAGLARVAIWVGEPWGGGSRLLAVELADVGRGLAVGVAPGAMAAARRGALFVEVHGAGLAALAWRGAAAVELLPFLCGFETGTACGIWSFVLAAEICNGVDDDCDTLVDDGDLCADSLPCTDDSCNGVAGCSHASTCVSGFSCCVDGCADLQNDPQHCGSCTFACSAIPHGAPGCSTATCVVGSCSSGWNNCNGVFGDGCETDTTSNVDHCGSCGRPCGSIPHGMASCSASTCVVGSCSSGWNNCNGVFGDGCETDTTSNVDHCGGCGRACGSIPHGTASCSASTCVVGSCSPGWNNCNGVYGDGCETDITSDPSHCGGCNRPCPAGSSCTNGQCTGLANGQVCQAAGQCLSGECIDGVCCSTPCVGLCQACNVVGSLGICANVPNGQDPADECPGAATCNGIGGCTP